MIELTASAHCGQNTAMAFISKERKTAKGREENYTRNEKRTKVQKSAKAKKRNHEQRKRATAVMLTQMMRGMKGTGGAERTERSSTGGRGAERTQHNSTGGAQPTERSRWMEQMKRSRADSVELAGAAEVCARH